MGDIVLYDNARVGVMFRRRAWRVARLYGDGGDLSAGFWTATIVAGFAGMAGRGCAPSGFATRT